MSDIKQSITTAPTSSMFSNPLAVPVSPLITPATLVSTSDMPGTYIFEAINQDVYILFGASATFAEIPDPNGRRIRVPANNAVELYVPQGSKYLKATSLVGVPPATLVWHKKS